MLAVLLFLMGVVSGAIGFKELITRFNQPKTGQFDAIYASESGHGTNPNFELDTYGEPRADSTFFRTHLIRDIKVTKRLTKWSFMYESDLVSKMYVSSGNSPQKLLLHLNMEAYCPECNSELNCAIDEQKFLVKSTETDCEKCKEKKKVEWSVTVAISVVSIDNQYTFYVDFDQHRTIGFMSNSTLKNRTNVQKICMTLKSFLPQKVNLSDNHLFTERLSTSYPTYSW